MWIVMTSAAYMPQNCWGKYRNVAMVKIDPYWGSTTANNWRPKQIHPKHKGIQRIVHMGHHHVGKTDRDAFTRAFRQAEKRVKELNSAMPIAEADLLWSWGGSA